MSLSPFIRKPASIQRSMLLVIVALVPGIIAYVWQIGAGMLLNIAIACMTALACEAAVLALRRRPVAIALKDGSALVTAVLIALAFPPIVPWWLTVLAVFIAIVLAKHLYGGLGQNPFNPAMVAYCAIIVSYPALMSQWPAPGQLDFAAQAELILGGYRDIDAISGATALDTMRTTLRAGHGAVGEVLRGDAFGFLGGRGWEIIGFAYLLGGVFLLSTRVISWHIPAAFFCTFFLVSGAFWLVDAARFAPPWFHLASGGAMLSTFFIITDPVTGATTPLGKIIFAAGVALIAWLIRTFGVYPDGIAFAILLMNLCVPLIDMKTQPAVFGYRGKEAP